MSRTKLIIVSLLLSFSTFSWADQSYRDPYEGYNRFMFNVNDRLDHYIMTPVARGYRKITPSPVRTGVNNFFNNLRDVVSFGSNLLRLDIEKASTDLVRVGINTTFGLGGLINFADAGQIPNNKSTLGDTFASWGWKNSNYFVYPFLGPSTVRDSLGSTVSSAFPVQNAIFKDSAVRWSVAALDGVATRESLLDVTDSLDEAALDRYSYTRDIYMKLRNKQVGGSLFTADNEEDEDIDSLVPAENNSDSVQESKHARTSSVPKDKPNSTKKKTLSEVEDDNTSLSDMPDSYTIAKIAE